MSAIGSDLGEPRPSLWVEQSIISYAERRREGERERGREEEEGEKGGESRGY